MQYRQVVKSFHEATNNHFHKGSGIDYLTAWEAWNSYVDGLCKDGIITQKQRDNWDCPFKYGKRL